MDSSDSPGPSDDGPSHSPALTPFCRSDVALGEVLAA